MQAPPEQPLTILELLAGLDGSAPAPRPEQDRLFKLLYGLQEEGEMEIERRKRTIKRILPTEEELEAIIAREANTPPPPRPVKPEKTRKWQRTRGCSVKAWSVIVGETEEDKAARRKRLLKAALRIMGREQPDNGNGSKSNGRKGSNE